MKNYRPDDWKNPHKEDEPTSQNFKYTTAGREAMIFEAGADAMLEALKKSGEKVDRKTTVTNNWNLETKHQFEKGWYVFIPDEGAKE